MLDTTGEGYRGAQTEVYLVGDNGHLDLLGSYKVFIGESGAYALIGSRRFPVRFRRAASMPHRCILQDSSHAREIKLQGGGE